MLCAGGDEELVAGVSVFNNIAHSNRAVSGNDPPKLLPLLVCLERKFLARVYCDYFYCRLFVQRKSLKLPPRANILLVAGKVVHIHSIEWKPKKTLQS